MMENKIDGKIYKITNKLKIIYWPDNTTIE